MKKKNQSVSHSQSSRLPASRTDQSSEDSIPSQHYLGTWVPSMPVFHADSAHGLDDPMHLTPGSLYKDFFVRNELGRGAFGVVYLAEQISLCRTVALKVTDTSREDGCQREGQTMAQLEHPSIVRVYSQSVDPEHQRRLLCLQYVPGMNLRNLIDALGKHGSDWDGKSLIDVLSKTIDKDHATILEKSVSERDLLFNSNQLFVVCWLGAQIAFALDYAHESGFIHQDVKPENTIINRFGRPMLVDFNLASNVDSPNNIQGGTIPYMPPEFIASFVDGNTNELEHDGRSSDIYAVGVILWELATGELPFKRFGSKILEDKDNLAALMTARKRLPVSELISPRLSSAIHRALNYSRDKRYESAGALGRTLMGVARQESVLESRKRGTLSKLICRFADLSFVVAAIVPHVVASIFQIAYNQVEIVSLLNEKSQTLFLNLLFLLNPIIYGTCVFLAIRFFLPIRVVWKRLVNGLPVHAQKVESAREHLMLLPSRVALIGGCGWLAGLVLFPGILYIQQPFGWGLWFHFVFSFVICGAIAVTFSYALVLSVAVYSFFPELFARPERFFQECKHKLEPISVHWGKISVVASFIPLAAALFLIASFDPKQIATTPSNPFKEIAFKLLLIGLVCASVFGFRLLRRIGKSISGLIHRCLQ